MVLPPKPASEVPRVLHEPAKPTGHDPSSEYKTRIGAWMFLLYALVYVGFVAINVVDPQSMGNPAFFGLNITVTYGLGLIVFALLLALIYNRLCGAKEHELRTRRDAERK
jgi:uncharacterized membrane protein (DUF485 family)